MAFELIHESELRRVLADSKRIAVLGAHLDSARPAFYVPNYLFQQGYEVHGVNPDFAGEVLWGRPIVARLGDLTVDIDLVDVFRNSRHLPDHLPELVAMLPRPKVVWMQKGVAHHAVASALVRAGIDVVQDRCVMVEHRALLAGSSVWS